MFFHSLLFHTFLFVFIAEMADKTQLMIMAMMNRFRIKSVLCGLILGVVAISGLSVLAGNLIGEIIPIWMVKICGAALFLFFVFYNLVQKDEEENAHKTHVRFPVLSIACTFLLAELGDKTQLATVALAADHMEQQLQVFLGASAGLIAANIFGIFLGRFLFSHISESCIKVCSSFIFLFFGSINIFELLPVYPLFIIAYSVVIITLAYILFTRTHAISSQS